MVGVAVEVELARAAAGLHAPEHRRQGMGVAHPAAPPGNSAASRSALSLRQRA